MYIKELTEKVKLGRECHNTNDHVIGCNVCPYLHEKNCVHNLVSDALEIADYWKGKYESTLLATPPMILHTDPAPIRIEPVDIKSTLKSIKTMERLEKVAKKATEALDEASEAIRALKEELEND